MKKKAVDHPPNNAGSNKSELERMTDLTRRIINVAAKELRQEKRKDERKHDH